MDSDPLAPIPPFSDEPEPLEQNQPEPEPEPKQEETTDTSLLELRHALEEEAEAQKKLSPQRGLKGFVNRLFHRSSPVVEVAVPVEQPGEPLVEERIQAAVEVEPESSLTEDEDLLIDRMNDLNLTEARIALEEEEAERKDLNTFLEEEEQIGDWKTFEQPLPEEEVSPKADDWQFSPFDTTQEEQPASPFDLSEESSAFTEPVEETETHPWQFTPEIDEGAFLLGEEPLAPAEADSGPQLELPPAAEEKEEQKQGFFGRIFSSFKKEKQPTDYDVDDQIVTSRLHTSTLKQPTGGVVKPEHVEEPAEQTPDEAVIPATRKGVTAPFTESVAPEEENLPLSEEEFWDRLTNQTERYSPFEERDFHEHADMHEGATPLAELPRDTGFLSPFDESEEDVPPDAPVDQEADLVDRIDMLGTKGKTGALIFDEDDRSNVLDARSSAGVDGVITNEIRSVALEDYQQTLEEARAAEEEEAAHPSRRFNQWVRSNRVYIAVVLVALVIGLLAITVGIPAYNRVKAANVRPTVNPGDLPYPTAIRMTGGWYINMQPGTITDGKWDPQGAEWLQGTELRRLVALPWSRQLEAVVRAMLPGDVISMYMSNNDLQDYKVISVEQVDRSQVDILSGTSEALVVIVYEEGTDQRWVMICEPK